MAILNNTSLGFSNGQSDCDCRNSEFCQIVVKEDNPAWQIVSECDELSGSQTKLPCENNIVTPQYFNTFTAADPTHVEVGSTIIDWLGTAVSGTDGTVSSGANFLTVGKFYVIRFTIVGHTQGTLTVSADSFSVYQANGNGNWSFVLPAFDDVLDFIGSVGETAFDGNMINLFIGCIRTSELYDIISDGGEGGTIFSLPSQNKVCKAATISGRMNYRDNTIFVAGQTYHICFTIEELTAGQLEVLLGSNSGGYYAANGRYCVDIVYNGSYLGNSLSFIFDADFDGCISDITVHLVPTINVGIFDADGNEVPGGIVTETIENTVKVTLDPELPEGCYTIGVADSCSNYKNQFFGDILENPVYEPYSATLNTTTGRRDFISENGDYTDTIKYFNAICCGKLYDMTINGIYGSVDVTSTLESMEIRVNIGGTTYIQTWGGAVPLPAPFEIDFTNMVAGCENQDVEITFFYEFANVDSITYIEFQFDEPETFLEMQPDQFCPEFMSECLKVVETTAQTCDTMLIKYRSEQNAFGFDYTSSGYTEADGFYNMLRIPARLWKASYPKTKEVQKLSNGRRNAYYTDIDKKYILTTGMLPEYIHDALSNAVDHETLIIEGREFVSEQTDYSPQWNKSSALASVEVELFLQKERTLSTFC